MRPAATLILLRDSDAGVELFMMRRNEESKSFAGAYVFPGGTLDPADSDRRALERVVGLSGEEANARLGVESGGLAYWVAAARECFEEAGILCALDDRGDPVAPERVAELAQFRGALNRGEIAFPDFLAEHGLVLPAHHFELYAHWITPPTRPRRFDTRFFIVRAPAGQHGVHDDSEMVHSLWVKPAEALALAKREAMVLPVPTQATLKALSRFGNATEAFEHTRSREQIEVIRPCVAQGRDGQKLFRPEDAPYAEVHWCDPGETMQSTYDMVPGIPKVLDQWVTRIIAPNPGMMTGPGTNTYLVGRSELAVIDPGPAIEGHLEAILAAGGQRIRWILATHTHHDHSPTAAALKAATGAEIIGYAAPKGRGQDETFLPARCPADGERLSLGEITLRAVHTPGHASNHLCYLLEQTGMLFTGDHIMQGSTVVIGPPDGDMRAYLQSLRKAHDVDPAIIAPGHGYLIGSPQREIRTIIAHRMWREERVLKALRAHGRGTPEDLVPEVYAELVEKLKPMAARSLLAHLMKLEADGLATSRDGCYYPVQ